MKRTVKLEKYCTIYGRLRAAERIGVTRQAIGQRIQDGRCYVQYDTDTGDIMADWKRTEYA